MYFIYVDFHREYAKAKQCLNKLIASNCTFPPTVQEMFDLSFSDHNPYCANNRDPGATGNDQCHGVKDPSKNTDNNAKSAVIKSSVSQPLLFYLVLLLFSVQI